jgi:glycosyltransferase involved in cell wall biosynthesis
MIYGIIRLHGALPMMSLFVLAILCVAFAALPAGLFLANLRLFQPPPQRQPQPGEDADPRATRPWISVLIPARNEEDGIAAAVESVLASQGVNLEVVVMDDQSEDRTAQVVRDIAQRDERVRLETAPALPASGWCGKQHACHALSKSASHDLMVFLDADVRLSSDALERAIAFLRSSGAALVSGFPRQETGTLGEKLLIPLIHFVLLGFLPLQVMRTNKQVGLGAGCGQFILVDKAAYEAVGGHGHDWVRPSLHEGIKLPRAFRSADYHTDLFDATDLVSCRMYRGFAQTRRGLAKNATEGMGSPGQIGFWTLMLGLGQVAPLPLLILAASLGVGPWTLGLLGLATILAYLPRLISVGRFRQPLIGAILHPLGVLLLLAIQWQALIRQKLGKPAAWRGRSYPASPA